MKEAATAAAMVGVATAAAVTVGAMVAVTAVVERVVAAAVVALVEKMEAPLQWLSSAHGTHTCKTGAATWAAAGEAASGERGGRELRRR